MRGFLWGVCRVNAGPDGASPPSFDARCEPRCSAGVAVDAAGAGASRRDGTIRRDIAASQCCSASQRRTDAAGRIAARRRAAADGQRAGTAIGPPGAGRAARAPGGAPPRAAAGAGGSAADGGSQHAARRGESATGPVNGYVATRSVTAARPTRRSLKRRSRSRS